MPSTEVEGPEVVATERRRMKRIKGMRRMDRTRRRVSRMKRRERSVVDVVLVLLSVGDLRYESRRHSSGGRWRS